MRFTAPRVRRFGFKGYYYDPEKDPENETQRIKFKRIRKSPKPKAKPVRRYIILLLAVLFFVWYLQGVEEDQAIQVEQIQIEDISSGAQ